MDIINAIFDWLLQAFEQVLGSIGEAIAGTALAILIPVLATILIISIIIAISLLSSRAMKNKSYERREYIRNNKDPDANKKLKQKNKKLPQKNINPDKSNKTDKGIRGTAGQFNGKIFNITGTLKMGRNPEQANIIFDSKTPGISALHCEISNTTRVLTLTDNGSSNGTFLNGQQITSGLACSLKPGDTFYLGSSENSFSVF
jgi:pSer/pThr/pTyr-binding forkhead associated (FHA) protein